MNASAVTLVLISTVMHAGWNLLAYSRRRAGTFILRMLLVVAAIGLVPMILSQAILPPLPPIAWVCVVVSGICCGAYYLFLVRAYTSSDFTTAYPVARALPVLLVGVGDVLRSRCPTAAGWLGMGLVAAGCVLCALRSFRDLSFRRYWNSTMLWLLLTALGTVGYTISDKVASEAVSQGPGTAARYGYFFFLASLGAYALGRQLLPEKKAASESLGWKMPVLAGALCWGAYWLVLWSYQLTEHAAYIVAFRQFSIVVGVCFAFAFLKESGRAVRLTGAVLMTIGLLLIALGGE